jgi:hypothetical protein
MLLGLRDQPSVTSLSVKDAELHRLVSVINDLQGRGAYKLERQQRSSAPDLRIGVLWSTTDRRRSSEGWLDDIAESTRTGCAT